MKFKHFLSSAACLGALACALPAWAQALPESGASDAPRARATSGKDAIHLLLGARHELPERALFERASKTAESDLLQIADDASVFPMHRYRALQALGAYWPSDRSFALYTKVYNTSPEGSMVRHRMLMLFGAHFGARGIDILRAALVNADVQIRRTAVEALVEAGTDEARAAIREAAERESDEALRARMKYAGARVN